MALVFLSFLGLSALTLMVRTERAAALARRPSAWLLDGAGLIVQGIAIPVLQAGGVYGLCSIAMPQAQGVLRISPVAAFLLNFVLVDYLYYWNHRRLHSRRWWPVHLVHHTPAHVDVFVTARNTLWTPLLIVYVWANGLFVFLLDEAAPFVLAAELSASLDLWRHTSFAPRTGSKLHRLLRLIVITPHEHLWHHSRDQIDCNYGANLALWDRLHGTYYSPAARPARFGVPAKHGLRQAWLFPFARGKAEAAK